MKLAYPTAVNALVRPEVPAVISRRAVLSHAALEASVLATARGLASHGVRRGDRVALLAPNSPEWCVVLHAVARLGAVLVPLHARLAPAEISDRALRVMPKMILVSEETAQHAPALERDGHRCFAVGELAARGGEEAVPDFVDGDAVHSILFTSGSSGRPKGAVLTFANHLASARSSAGPLGVSAADRWLLCLPMSHVGGLAVALRAAILGFTVLLHERFDPEEAWRSLCDEGVTIVSLVPEMLDRVLAVEPGARTPVSLRVVLLGGGPAPAALLRTARARGFRVSTTYGLTEAASQVTTLPWTAAAAESEECGPPIPGTEVRLLCYDGAIAGRGEEGEIVVRGPTIMREYFDDPGATRYAFDEGWFRTGDIGRWGELGGLVVLSRRRDLFVSGGENVSPAEIEFALLAHPAVAGAIVAGVSDARWGCVPAALVTLRAGGAADHDDLEAFVAARLAPFKVPRRWLIVDELPLTSSGKPDRAAAHRFLVRSEDGPRRDSKT